MNYLIRRSMGETSEIYFSHTLNTFSKLGYKNFKIFKKYHTPNFLYLTLTIAIVKNNLNLEKIAFLKMFLKLN